VVNVVEMVFFRNVDAELRENLKYLIGHAIVRGILLMNAVNVEALVHR
jgi:hypothetical protein